MARIFEHKPRGPALYQSGPLVQADQTAASGVSITVTLSNGVGAPYDFFHLAPVGSPNSTYVQWTYVGAGVTSRTWTVAMPTAVGAYEFRLFYNNSFTRLATSPPVNVQ